MNKEDHHLFGKLSVTLALAGTIVIRLLAQVLPLNGKTTTTVAEQLPIFFMPADYTFLIAVIVYLGLVAFVIYQYSPKAPHKALKHIRPWFVLSCLASSVCIIFWHYDLLLYTVLEVIILLVALIVIYQDLKQYLPQPTRWQWWCLHTPISLGLAWITVVAIANLTAALYLVGWDGFGLSPVWWGVAMVMLTMLIAVVVLVRERDYVFNAVITWALFGVAWNYPSQPTMIVAVLIAFGVQLISALCLVLHPARRSSSSML